MPSLGYGFKKGYLELLLLYSVVWFDLRVSMWNVLRKLVGVLNLEFPTTSA